MGAGDRGHLTGAEVPLLVSASYSQRRTHMTVTTTVTTATERLGVSILRIRLGAALQRHRVQRGMTQAELAEFADLSLKYVGEIERGEANTTLEVLERLAAAVQWNPMDALEGMREPLSEGVRMLLIDEVSQIHERLRNMARWLQALDPAHQIKAARRAENDQPVRGKAGRRARRERRERRERQEQLQRLQQEQEELERQQQEPPPQQEPLEPREPD